MSILCVWVFFACMHVWVPHVCLPGGSPGTGVVNYHPGAGNQTQVLRENNKWLEQQMLLTAKPSLQPLRNSVFILFFWDGVLLCSSDWSGTHRSACLCISSTGIKGGYHHACFTLIRSSYSYLTRGAFKYFHKVCVPPLPGVNVALAVLELFL